MVKTTSKKRVRSKYLSKISYPMMYVAIFYLHVISYLPEFILNMNLGLIKTSGKMVMAIYKVIKRK